MFFSKSTLPQHELEWRILYAVVVAGKSAEFARGVLSRLLPHQVLGPYDQLRLMRARRNLPAKLREARTGNYRKNQAAIEGLLDADFDLATCTPWDLDEIKGIGPKTARLFILWTRPDAECAALDAHVLRWLSSLGHDAPRSTPAGRRYARLERIFLEEAKKRGMTARELDAQVRAEGSGYREELTREGQFARDSLDK
jgi:thermostable 8-oxoguanine DNA glycosylase